MAFPDRSVFKPIQVRQLIVTSLWLWLISNIEETFKAIQKLIEIPDSQKRVHWHALLTRLAYWFLNIWFTLTNKFPKFAHNVCKAIFDFLGDHKLFNQNNGQPNNSPWNIFIAFCPKRWRHVATSSLVSSSNFPLYFEFFAVFQLPPQLLSTVAS